MPKRLKAQQSLKTALSNSTREIDRELKSLHNIYDREVYLSSLMRYTRQKLDEVSAAVAFIEKR